MAKLLIVDDEPGVRFTLKEVAQELGHTVVEARNGREALQQVTDEVDLVITDLAMPELGGLELLAELRALFPDLPVVLLTARGSERVAVRAIKGGAFDYVTKPFDVDELDTVITRALDLASWKNDARAAALQAQLGRPLIGSSAALRRVVDRALKFAKREAPVLVTGETGTGKELLALLLHSGSPRARGSFIRFNCAAVAEEVAESELFGHVRGAFTGASHNHRGFFSQAHGGTLVLDEVGELPPRLQPKLLRTLQSGEIQPVGAASIERVDVRVIACTHRNLAEEARRGQFREDLYYRLAVLELVMPPLRERQEDIPALAEFFARESAAKFGLEGVTISEELAAALSQRQYRGNIRELENLVTRLVALSEGGPLEPHLLGSTSKTATSAPISFREQVEALELRLLRDALGQAGNNQSEAARLLGLSRATFLDKLKRYNLWTYKGD